MVLLGEVLSGKGRRGGWEREGGGRGERGGGRKDGRAGKKGETDKDIQRDRQTDRQTEREAKTETDRQADGPTDRQRRVSRMNDTTTLQKKMLVNRCWLIKSVPFNKLNYFFLNSH